MAIDQTSPETLPADDAWQEIESLVHDIARLSKSELSYREFYTELLDRAVNALAAVGGAVWLIEGGESLRLEHQNNLAGLGLTAGASQQQHAALLDHALRSGEGKLIAPRSGAPENGQPGNPTDLLLLLCPILVEQETVGLIEVFQRPGTSRAAQVGYLRFLTALAELSADFHANIRLRQMRDRSTLWGQFQHFTERIHASLELRPTAYAIANEGRRLIECDRLSVALRRGNRYRLTAISGIDTFDRRSDQVRTLEKLIRAVAAVDEPLWRTDEREPLPPQIEQPLQAYLDASHARALAVIPLHVLTSPDAPARAPHKPVGAIVVEKYDTGRVHDAFRQRVAAVSRQSEPALHNALEYHRIPFLPLLKLWQRAFWFLQLRQLPKTVLAAAAIAAAILALIFVPADFEIEGAGELQPELRRDVFATSSGVVDELRVQHAQSVEEGETLVVLRDSDLEFRFSQVLGEIQTTQKQLNTVEVSRRATLPNDPQAQQRYEQLTAEEEELKVRLASLEEQLGILQQQRKQLEIRSPLTGTVLTWDVEQTLRARPVQRGQALLTVADLDGEWVVEMRVPDDDVSYVMEAQAALKPGEQLPVRFILASEPGVAYHGAVKKMSKNTEAIENEKPSLLITVAFRRDDVPQLRPGAGVVPRIYCGRRSIGFVWLHDVWEAIQARVLF